LISVKATKCLLSLPFQPKSENGLAGDTIWIYCQNCLGPVDITIRKPPGIESVKCFFYKIFDQANYIQFINTLDVRPKLGIFEKKLKCTWLCVGISLAWSELQTL